VRSIITAAAAGQVQAAAVAETALVLVGSMIRLVWLSVGKQVVLAWM